MNKFIRMSIVCILMAIILGMVGCNDKTESTTKAVYIRPKNGGQLALEEIRGHPEVTSAASIDELKGLRIEKAAIWIDKDAMDLIDPNWIRKKAESRIPIVLIGYNDALYSFREKLPIFGIEGPCVDWDEEKLGPGFSVGMLREKNSTSTTVFIKGYNTTPGIERILSITDMLLEGEFP